MDLPWWQKLLGARLKEMANFSSHVFRCVQPLFVLPVLHAWCWYMRLIYAAAFLH